MPPQGDYMDDTEQYFKEIETNVERSFSIIGKVIYRLFDLIAGALEPLVAFFLPKEENKDDRPF